MRIPRSVVLVAGAVAVILGLVIGITQTIALFALIKANSFARVYRQYRMLTETGGLIVLALSNWFMAMYAFVGGLELLFPGWMGRHPKFRLTVKKIESSRGAYRESGSRLILGGALSLVMGVSLSLIAHFFLLRLEMVFTPLVVMACGVVGMLAGRSHSSSDNTN